MDSLRAHSRPRRARLFSSPNSPSQLSQRLLRLSRARDADESRPVRCWSGLACAALLVVEDDAALRVLSGGRMRGADGAAEAHHERQSLTMAAAPEGLETPPSAAPAPAEFGIGVSAMGAAAAAMVEVPIDDGAIAPGRPLEEPSVITAAGDLEGAQPAAEEIILDDDEI